MQSKQPPSSVTISDMPTQQLPIAANVPTAQQGAERPLVSGWMLAPQRLFLGGTFLYAGMQKVTDPQFFHKATPGYIGNQLIGFAQASPLHLLLVKVAIPHAVIFGWTIALGEMAIGLGTLLGLFFRPAAFFGMLLSILFFLTASWSVYPYFYGADIVFAFCWLTMLLTGPALTGLPSLDRWLQRKLFPGGLMRHGLLIRAGAIAILGTNVLHTQTAVSQVGGGSRQPHFFLAQQRKEKRRTFIKGLVVGGVSLLGVGVLGSILHIFERPTASGPARTAGANNATIGQVSEVPVNSAVAFVVPGTGDPGLLIHLPSKEFVAFDAVCTHAGCEVGYDAGISRLVCPCHGAQYDPAHQATVLTGPTSTPLTSLPIHIDPTTGTITLQ